MNKPRVTEADKEIELIGKQLSDIEWIDLGNVTDETRQAPGVVVFDNPFVSGPWHDA